MSLERFHHVKKGDPCPVCNHTDWCLVSNDGGTCICQRIQSERPMVSTGGWIHVLKRMEAPVRRVRAALPRRTRLFDAERAMAGFRAEYEDYPLESPDGPWTSAAELGRELGLAGAAVDRLLPGKSKFYQSWCFPMRDGEGAVVGIRLRRYGKSDKFSVSGSRDGLFYNPDVEPAQECDGCRYRELVIVEGASDCAAGYEIGLPCVGRSSCATGVQELKDLCRRLNVNRVTIIADNDRYKSHVCRSECGAPVRKVWRPGNEGAEKLAVQLGRMYRIVTPPMKDLRDWIHAGLTRKNFDLVAKLQKWRLPK